MQRWIYWNEDGTLIVDPQARRALKAVATPRVVSILGVPKSGKSFILNKLSRKDCFPVSSSLQGCTKGLNFLIDEELILVDTEGIGGIQSGQMHDSKIFVLAFLLSSLVIYNSFGVIDELSINKLSFVTQLTTSIRIENKPTLLWLLRDFALDLRNQEGDNITADQYLESALSGDTPLRLLIRDTFPERGCSTLVRPCEEESDIADIVSSKLRVKFLSDLQVFGRRVGMLCRQRAIGSQGLSGKALCDLADKIVESLNGQELPVLDSVWSGISEENCSKAKENALSYMNSAISNMEEMFPLEAEDLSEKTKILKSAAMEIFNEDAMGDKQKEFEDELKQEIKEISKEIEINNLNHSRKQSQGQLLKLYKDYIEQMDFNSSDELAQAWNEIKNEYDAGSKGPAKAEIWSHFATQYMLTTTKLLTQKIELKQRQEQMKLKQQLQLLNSELDLARKRAVVVPETEESSHSCSTCQAF